MLLLCLLLENVHLKWLLKFVKGFLCVYWDYHMEIIFQLVNMVYHIDWFPYIEESLHPWDKTDLIMICNSFYVVLDSDFQTFVGDLCIYVHQWYCSVIFYSCGIFGFGISVMVASWNGLGRFPSLQCSWRVWAWNLLGLLVEFAWSHLALGFCFLKDFYYSCNFMFVIGLFIFSVSSWFSFWRLHFSKNLSISASFSILLVYNCS